MNALEIVAVSVTGSLGYLSVVVWSARRVAGQWAYNTWKRERAHYPSITPRDYDDFVADAELTVFAFALSLIALPITLAMVVSSGRTGTFIVDPKHVRQARELQVARDRIAHLERETGLQ